MEKLNVKTLEEFFELKKQYIDKYSREDVPEYYIIPDEFYQINDYRVLHQLLKEALEKNVRLEDLEYIQNYRRTFKNIEFIDNIDKTIEEKYGKMKR